MTAVAEAPLGAWPLGLTGRYEADLPARSDVAVDVDIPTAPFWGDRIVKGVPLADYVPYLDERALFLGQWGLKPSRGDGPSYEELVETEGRPRLRRWLDRVQTEGMIEPAVVYGYFPCYADGDDLVVVHHEGPSQGEERVRFSFPRQRRDRHLCRRAAEGTARCGPRDGHRPAGARRPGPRRG